MFRFPSSEKFEDTNWVTGSRTFLVDRKTGNIMAKTKQKTAKRQTVVDKKLHRKLQTEQRESLKNNNKEVNSDIVESSAIPAPLVASFLTALNKSGKHDI